MEKYILRMVGQRIRDLRKQKGLSQEELGELASFHFSYIGGVERAEKNISLLNLQKIADALKVQVHDFFVYEEHIRVNKTDKEVLLNQINEQLLPLRSNELKKIKLFIKEIINND
ncbi:MAG: helix-turn-helix transcriptional regulator [Paenibacillaceae bacterium]